MNTEALNLYGYNMLLHYHTTSDIMRLLSTQIKGACSIPPAIFCILHVRYVSICLNVVFISYYYIYVTLLFNLPNYIVYLKYSLHID